MKDHFRMLAAYNTWANKLMFDCIAQLGEADYHKPMGAYFSSINRTLNHVLVADQVWLARFNGEVEPYDTLDDLVLYEDFADMRGARAKCDGHIEAMVSLLTAEDIAAVFRFRTLRKPLVEAMPMSHALAHFFNHQTHHRGQVSVMLTQLGLKTPAMDMLYFQRELQAKAA
ncbi:MAG: damage-inducible protein DinB [Hyphomicrobiaceae bacterium]|nr:damage-inducible protein DinB [Hyphomicrobiaceae bacterium]